jgi:hypothetical protein
MAQERGDVRVAARFKMAAAQRIGMVFPSVVLAQVWRNGTRQVRLARTLSNPGVTEAPLHHEDAKLVGELLRESATADVADAHVAVLAGRLGAAVITSDSGDIAKLDPALPILKV